MNNLFTIRHAIYLCFLLLTLLAGCAHIRKDGPPKFYVDERKIADAVPKLEPRAKFGNMKTYVVFGKRYQVLQSFKHYEEVGIASWYGTKFHARRTSSGERYNMLAMTAAHKTLPLPTYVEVTNLANHRRVIVKVNDRGPFAPKRIIDLSYVAAKKLGMLGKGTAFVRIRAIDTNSFRRPILFARNRNIKPLLPPFRKRCSTYHAINNVKSTWARPIYLQVGAFRERANAEKLKKQLTVLLLGTSVKIFSRESLYRVQLGPFQNKAVADKITERLRRLGMKANKTYL